MAGGEELGVGLPFCEITILFTMTTATVEIKNNIALDLLKNLPTTAELPKAGLAKARGGLRKYANPNLIPFEKGTWEKAVVEKYAKQ